MSTEPGYTVLPLSALKDHATDLFEALKAGATVYVSKHGRITTAFRPRMFVPESVAALYTSPHLDLHAITARDIGRQSLSQVLAEAAIGLPAAAIKEGRLYGMLTPATAPHPDTIPDQAAVGAKANALLDYQERNPDASIDDIMAFSNSLDATLEEQRPPLTWPLAAEFDNPAAVHDDIQAWREQGSDVEDVVQALFEALNKGIATADEHHRRPNTQTLSGLAEHIRPHLATSAIIEQLAEHHGGLNAPLIRTFVAHAEQLEAAGDPVDARTGYVRALTTELATDTLPNVGVMWRLGNLARHAHRPAEAAVWFRLSLAYDAISDTIEHSTMAESILGIHRPKVG